MEAEQSEVFMFHIIEQSCWDRKEIVSLGPKLPETRSAETEPTRETQIISVPPFNVRTGYQIIAHTFMTDALQYSITYITTYR